MEIVAIGLARVVALIEFDSWDPFGRSTTLDGLEKLVERFNFAKYPKNFDEINLQSGIELVQGQVGEVVVDKITLYQNGIVIDTRSSTDNSEKVLDDLMAFATELFGAQLKGTKRHYVSQVIFRSELHLARLNAALDGIAKNLTQKVSENMTQEFRFEPTAIVLNADVSNSKIFPVPFSIERRNGVSFSQNTYFSSAPLRTGEHLELIRQFEKSISSGT